MPFIKCSHVWFYFADMAMLGQELMLCKADDLDLIKVTILTLQGFIIGPTSLMLHN